MVKHAHVAPREGFWMRHATTIGVLVLICALGVVVGAAVLVLLQTS
jgi:hypothetical protein